MNDTAPIKLDFLVAGLNKCGTTTLCSMLGRHSQVCIPEMKEPNFFSRERYKEQWPWYCNLFADATEGQLLGEGSTFYTTGEFEVRTRERLQHYYPDIKLIFIIRDPIDRMESSYREFHHSGPHFGVDCPFTVKEAMQRFPSIVHDSLYWSRIANYSACFPEEQIKIVFLEELRQEPQRIISEIESFLGITQEDIPLIRDNAGEGKFYDTRILRWARNARVIGPQLAKIPAREQHPMLAKWGLRKRFVQAPTWGSDVANLPEMRQVAAEAAQLLAHCGKPVSFWPRIARYIDAADAATR